MNQLFGRYSLTLGIAGLVSDIFLLPGGIFSGFLFGSMAMTCAILAKRERRIPFSTAGLVLGILAVMLSSAFYYSFYIFFGSLRDPSAGPQMTRIMLELLANYGITPQQFLQQFAF